jgi:hypothetical protein
VVLNKGDFKAIAKELGSKPMCARKVAFVAARKARRVETVDTHWNGKETSNIARPGDFIVTSLTRRKTILRDRNGKTNNYVIKATTFKRLYEQTAGQNRLGRFFKSRNFVAAIYLSGGFDIFAPWGQRERAAKGYLLLNGREVYGNNAGTFEATYEIVDR